MELKYYINLRSLKRAKVLIVPLWNWNNVISPSKIENVRVLIVPLWNWNLINVYLYLFPLVVLIVPLWNWNRVWADQRAGAWDCFNRTFMELKSHKYLTEQVFYIILSVPLHNWNRPVQTSPSKPSFILPLLSPETIMKSVKVFCMFLLSYPRFKLSLHKTY